MDVIRARKLLTDRLAELDERECQARSAADEQLPDHAVASQHPADYGSDLTSEMEHELIIRTMHWQRRQILQALQRIEAGTYGRCRVDGEPIDDARLEARPEAELCLRHQQQAERHGAS